MRAGHHFRTTAIGALAIFGALVPALAVAAQPRSPFVVAAAFPVWWSAARVQAAAEAAGVVSRTGRWNIVVVYGGLDVGRQLSRNGAWAIFDPRVADCTSQGNIG